MGFFEWISGVFGTKSSEENKDNENINNDSDLRNEVKDVESDTRGISETQTDPNIDDSIITNTTLGDGAEVSGVELQQNNETHT